MKIEATIVADSLSRIGEHRKTTFLAVMPRWILAELNTHRLFSRNSASSRAIPSQKMINAIKETPFTPSAWQIDHKGMQGKEYHDGTQSIYLNSVWQMFSRQAIANAEVLNNEDVTKQISNRLLEPFMWHTVMISATEWANFFSQRLSKYIDPSGKAFVTREDFINEYPIANQYSDMAWRKFNSGQAEIHIMDLAEAMYNAFGDSHPETLEPGDWHIPYKQQIFEDFGLTIKDVDKDGIPFAVKIGTIMAARTSYTVAGHDLSEWTLEKYVQKDLELRVAEPVHASPFEHCSQSMYSDFYHNSGIIKPLFDEDGIIVDNEIEYGWCGNIRGFRQYRKMIDNEYVAY